LFHLLSLLDFLSPQVYDSFADDGTPLDTHPLLRFRQRYPSCLPGAVAMTLTACPQCALFRKQIAQLELDIEQLQAERDFFKKQGAHDERDKKRSAHPFRKSDDQLQDGPPKKSGRPDNHPPANRPQPENIDQVVPVALGTCPDCGAQLTDLQTHAQFQSDIVVSTIERKFEVQSGFCPGCQCRHHGRHPLQTSDALGAAGNQIGPVALTMAAEMKHDLGVSYDNISAFLKTYFGIYVNPSTILQAEDRLLEKAQPTFALLLDALRQCNVVHADETGWRIGRVNAWLWVFSSQNVTIYAIRYSRGSDVPSDILGAAFDGILIVDGLNSYDALEYTKGQCNAHLLRRVKAMIANTTDVELAAHLADLIQIIKDAIGLAERRAEYSETYFAQKARDCQMMLEGWLACCESYEDDELRKLAKHMNKHLQEWFTFLRREGVPPTNNHAERQLRPSVVVRKTNGCHKTLAGALKHAVLMSLMVSCEQQNRRFLDLALSLWRERNPQAIPLPSLPEAG
jgi:transposase